MHVYLVVSGERGEGYTVLGAYSTESRAVIAANEAAFERDLHYVKGSLYTDETAESFVDYVGILDFNVIE